MYHLELRQFPHVARRFNQSEQQVLALAEPWVGEQWIEEAERKWNMNEATLTILDGPKLSMAELAMGRGWRNAQRRSDDVTERVLGQFRVGRPGAPGAVGSSGIVSSGAKTVGAGGAGGASSLGDLELLADSLGLELLPLLDSGPVAPARVLRLAQERLGGVGLGEALVLAERAVRSLITRRLVVLMSRDGGGDVGGAALGSEQVETVLGAIETWASGDGSPVVVARKG